MKKNWYDVWNYSGFSECLSRGVEATSPLDAIQQVVKGTEITKTGKKSRERAIFKDENGKEYLANKLPRHPDDMFIGV